MFIFRDRVTKKVVKEVNITEEEFKVEHGNELTNIFPEYEIEKHTAAYEQI